MTRIRLVALLLLTLGLVWGCKKTPDPLTPIIQPALIEVTLAQPTFVSRSGNSASLTAIVTGVPSGQAVTAGFVWSATALSPTLADNKTSKSLTIYDVNYALSDSLTGLSSQAIYYARGYVTSATGTVYSPTLSFQVKYNVADVLAQTLTGLLQGRNIGYGFTIYDGANLRASGAGGPRSRANDAGGERPYTIDTKMHIASMSKTIAAMAFLQLAAQKGVRTTDKITRYLPLGWAKGTNIDKITFGQLFNHRSGIIGLGNNCQNGAYSENIYSGLKQLIANGVTTANLGQYCYQNANVGLMRVLIPALSGYAFSGNDQTDDAQTQQRYLAYVQTNILSKVGINTAQPMPAPGDPTYCYSYPYPANQTGWNPGDFSTTLGAYGWYLTPREAGNLYATVLSSTDESVLPTAYKDTLLLNNLGCFRANTSLGNTAYHDGWWYLSANAPYVGLRTIWMKLPNNLTVTLFTNSLNAQSGLFPVNDGTDIVPFVFRAYTTARQLTGGRLAPVTFTLEHPEPH